MKMYWFVWFVFGEIQPWQAMMRASGTVKLDIESKHPNNKSITFEWELLNNLYK